MLEESTTLPLISYPQGLAIVGLGLAAGIMGGLTGLGGSLVTIPGMTMALGYDQHLYQATAMVANLAVAIPAAWEHRRRKALEPRSLIRMAPVAVIFVIVGVWLSNRSVFAGIEGGKWLGRVLALFLVYVIFLNLSGRKLGEGLDERFGGRITPWRSATVGGLAGIVSGLLGLSGGIILVPMRQLVLGLPLRRSIANSAALTCLNCVVGAVYKNATLSVHGGRWQDSLLLAAVLSPTCWVGGRLGARLTHRLPLRVVRATVVALMVVATVKMAALRCPWGM